MAVSGPVMTRLVVFFLLVSSGTAQASDAVQQLLDAWRPQVERDFAADQGERVWYRETGESRSCTSCHTDSIFIKGRHQKTGKVIEPMAPSVNPERLTEVKKINKWFLRNCKWTFGRECTLQERGDVLVWLRHQ